jgi:hypothetical protein
METYGKMSVETSGFLRDLVSHAFSDEGSAAAAFRISRMRLSVALCKGNGVVFQRSAGLLARTTG